MDAISEAIMHLSRMSKIFSGYESRSIYVIAPGVVVVVPEKGGVWHCFFESSKVVVKEGAANGWKINNEKKGKIYGLAWKTRIDWKSIIGKVNGALQQRNGESLDFFRSPAKFKQKLIEE